jgi:hypothetical protein
MSMTAAGRRWIVLLPLAVLLVPMLWSWPATARREGREVKTYLTSDRPAGDFLAPFVRYYGEQADDSRLARFARLVERRVPQSGLIALENAENTSWARALAFAVAPRLIVPGGDSGWAVYRSRAPPPGSVGERRWHVGDYWLVRR